MSIETVVKSLLTTTAGITRVYPTVIPRDVVAPFALYTVDGFDPQYTLAGGCPTTFTTVEIELFGKTLAVCDTEFQKIMDNLSGINGTVVGDSTVSGFTVRNVFNSYEPELELHVKTINVDIILTL